MARHPGPGIVTMLAVVLLTACSNAHAGVSPTSRPSTSTPTPAPGGNAASGQMISLNTENGADLLFNSDGHQTGVLAQSSSSPYVRSRFGDRLFGILHYGGKSPGDPTLVAIGPAGTWTPLARPVPSNQFVDAIGSEDGTSWAMVTVSDNCSATSRATLALGTAAGVRDLARLPAIAAQWNLMSDNGAGIILQAAACSVGSTVVATELVDPITGQVTDLGKRLGAGCIFVAASDTGTFLCAFAGETGKIVLIAPDGSRHQYSFPVSAALCTGRESGFGVSPTALSEDARYIAASDTCMAPGDNGGRDQLLIIDTTSGAVVEGPRTLYLDGIEWLPDDQLIASQPRFSGRWPGGTWIVTPEGIVHSISSMGTAQERG